MKGLGLVFLVEEQEIVFYKRILHELILTVLAQNQLYFLKGLSLDLIVFKIRHIITGVIKMRAHVGAGIFKEEF